jgi:hypothetical protein
VAKTPVIPSAFFICGKCLRQIFSNA